MNPFMTTFTLLRLIYLCLVIWSAVMSFGGSLAISICGVLVCVLGWKYSERHLQ